FAICEDSAPRQYAGVAARTTAAAKPAVAATNQARRNDNVKRGFMDLINTLRVYLRFRLLTATNRPCCEDRAALAIKKCKKVRHF
ncbi:MAG: hypothetical protein WBZ19_25730, partial [Chthoniobacterales bacterium]